MTQPEVHSIGRLGEAMNALPEHSASDSGRQVAWPRSQGELAALVHAYADRLVRYAFRQLGNQQDAEDVVQDVFVRVFANRSNRTKISAIGPYLYRSVGNACTDLLRKRSCGAVFREEVDVSQLLGRFAGPREAAQAVEALRHAEALLARLPEEQAEVVRLRVFDDLRLREIADVVGCSLNTVCSRLRYGFKKLRSIVANSPE